jgi:nitrogen regulatory protein P-II 1
VQEQLFGRSSSFRWQDAVAELPGYFHRQQDPFHTPTRRKRVQTTVKKIEAIIKPFRLEDVRNALALQGIDAMTVTEVKGCGHQKGRHEYYNGAAHMVEYLPKLRIDIVVTEDQIEAALDAIMQTAKTGKIGDGKIFVSTIDEVVRIRTGEKGELVL